MTITARITIAGGAGTLTWEDGELAGDGGARAYVQALAARLEGAAVGPPSLPTTTTDHLASPLSFIALCVLASDRYPTFTGDVPDLTPLSELPEGAIA